MNDSTNDEPVNIWVWLALFVLVIAVLLMVGGAVAALYATIYYY